MSGTIDWQKVWQIENGINDEVFNVPCGLAIDHKSRRLVVVDGLAKVQKFKYLKNKFEVIVKESIGSKSILPQYVAVYNKNYFVTGLKSQGVFICDRKGKLVKHFETGIFIDPMGIAINDVTHVVYVAKNGENTISMFKTDGVYVKSFAETASPGSKLVSPWGIGVNRHGHVVVSDRERHIIHVYDSDGNILNKFGSEGSGPGQLKNPEGVAIDKVNSIYVCDNGNHRVQIFDETGRFICCLNEGTELLNPKGIAIDVAHNRVFVSAYNTVYVFEKM